MTIKLNVKQRAAAVGTLRFTCVFLMETLSRWIPATPEMEVKMLLSRHVWRMAQQADRLGKRARELRAPLHYNRKPQAEFAEALKQLATVSDTIDRVDAFHLVALPALAGHYRAYLAETDKVTDEPTAIICEQALLEIATMIEERRSWGDEIPPSRAKDSDALQKVKKAFAAAKEMIDYTEPAARTAPAAVRA
ncbi:MAG: hypothetical protein U1E61_10970 [Bradyrhizobium sp.]